MTAALWMLGAGLAIAQTSGPPDAKTDASPAEENTSSPFGLPPPFKAKPDTVTTDPAKPDNSSMDIPRGEMPPEEDKSDAPKVFSFNPVQSKREVEAGNYYFNKGNYIAAVSRYDEATKWNDGNAEAWLRLAEAQEKRPNRKAAREAYQKYLELAPDSKNASEIKKKLSRLKG
jgi:tetratricopeptide (TPR) repeat protein